jgi:hypothetical protein
LKKGGEAAIAVRGEAPENRTHVRCTFVKSMSSHFSAQRSATFHTDNFYFLQFNYPYYASKGGCDPLPPALQSGCAKARASMVRLASVFFFFALFQFFVDKLRLRRGAFPPNGNFNKESTLCFAGMGYFGSCRLSD